MKGVVVIGGYGRGMARLLMAMALQEDAMRGLGRSIGRADLVVYDECEHLRRMDMIEKAVDESPHPGERHRDNEKRVHSSRSRAGKSARWK